MKALFTSIHRLLLTHIHFNYLLTLWFVVSVGVVGYVSFGIIIMRGFDRMTALQELSDLSGWTRQITEQSIDLVFASEPAIRDRIRTDIAAALQEEPLLQDLAPDIAQDAAPQLVLTLSTDVSALAQHAEALINIPDTRQLQSSSEFNTILTLSARLTSYLQVSMRELIASSQDKLLALVYLATILLIFVLGSLAVIYLFVVRPMLRNVRENAANLTNEVEVRKQAEAQARNSEALYRLLVGHLPRSAVFLFDHRLRHSLAEGPMLATIGYQRDQFVDKTLEEALEPGMASALQVHYEQALTGEMSELQGSINGIAFHAQFLPVRDPADSIIGGLALVRDITTEKQAALDQVELVIERERSKLLADFVRDISHDFRTPLSVLATNLYLLRHDPSAEKRERRSETMQRQIERLSRMLDQLVTLSRLEIGRQFEATETDLATHIKMVHDRYLGQAENKGIMLLLNIQPDLPKISADTEQLNRAFVNLMDNALQYVGQGGSITLEAYIHPEEDRVVCAFQDTGAGISQVDLPHIFDPFFRGDKARSAETGGAGLGLTIVKRIALLHGGSVYASNTAGKGARFEIHLPVSEQKPSEDVPALAEA